MLDQRFIQGSLKVKNALSINKTIAPKDSRYKRMSRMINRAFESRLKTRSKSRSAWKIGLVPKKVFQKSVSKIRKKLSKNFCRNIATPEAQENVVSPYQDTMGISSSAAKLYKRLVSANRDSSRMRNDTISTNASSENNYIQKKSIGKMRNFRTFVKPQRALSGKSASSKRSIVINLNTTKTHSDVNIQTDDCKTPSECALYDNEGYKEYGFRDGFLKDSLSPAVLLPKIKIQATRCKGSSLF